MGLCSPNFVHFKPTIRFPHATPSVVWGPKQLAAAYQFPAVVIATDPLIGIVELGGGEHTADTAKAFAAWGLPAPIVKSISVDGGQNSPGSDADVEVALDIQWAAAAITVCTGLRARINVYYAPNTDSGFANAVKQAAADGCATISISWGAPEDQWGKSACQVFDSVCINATAAGSVIFAASGDNDSGDGESGDHVDFPASSPNVVGCGGTRKDASGESVWNDGTNGTGGGFSSFFPPQSFQVGAPLNGTGRLVPDVAAVADPQTGYQVMSGGQFITVGGTSAVAPLYAGLFAAISAAHGSRLGNILTTLYTHPAAFGDVTTGNNGTWRARAGVDPCTGLGVPIGTALLSVFAGTPPPVPTPPPNPTPTPPPVTGNQHLALSLNLTAPHGATGTYTLSPIGASVEHAAAAPKFAITIASLLSTFGIKWLGFILGELAAGKTLVQILNDIETRIFGFDPTPDKKLLPAFPTAAN